MMWGMRFAMLMAVAAQAIGGAVSDVEIRRQTAGIEKIAAQESPSMAIGTLLQTAAAVRPYVPAEASRLHKKAAELARQHRDVVSLSYADVRRWMELSPASGEAELRALGNHRSVFAALMSFYRFKKMPEKEAAMAVEAIRTARRDPSSENVMLQVVGSARPEAAAELFAIVAADPEAQSRMMDSVKGLFTGLFEAAKSRAGDVAKVVPELRKIIDAEGFASQSKVIVTLKFERDGGQVSTSTNRETLSAYLDLLERLSNPATQAAAAATLATLSSEYGSTDPSDRRPPIDGSLSLADAIQAIQAQDPVNMRTPELWRYLMQKPRSEEEARPILTKIVEWAARPGERDPFWFVSSLLNLDGRMPGWQLPAGLRPMVFQAAARLAPLARDAEAVMPLVEGMRAENVDPPAGAASAIARFKFAELSAALETRYDFSLLSLNGPKRTLQSARGKVVVLNFWAIWCVPCRLEMPILAAARSPKVEVMAVTEDSLERLRAFANQQPLNITMLMDPAGKVSEHYRVMQLPQTVVLNPRGGLVKHFRGPVTERTLREAIEAAARLR